jgi:hypothetical protein
MAKRLERFEIEAVPVYSSQYFIFSLVLRLPVCIEIRNPHTHFEIESGYVTAGTVFGSNPPHGVNRSFLGYT